MSGGPSAWGLAALLLVVACGPAEPLRSRRDAAQAYDQGRSLLSQGDPVGAEQAFARAESLDPDSPTLIAWRARAQELAGQVDAALATLDRGLGRFPQDADLRRNRAALRARGGALDAAAADLRILLSAGALTPAQAAEDPDLVLLRARPDLAPLVPLPALWAELVGEPGSVLLGDDYDAVLTLDAPDGALAVRDLGEPAALLRRTRVVEDVVGQGGGRTLRRVELTWRAVAPGQARLGPWLWTSGGVSGLTEPLPVEVVALGGRQAQPEALAGEDLVLPSTLLDGRPAPWAGELDGRLAVVGPPGAEPAVEVDGGPLAPEERWELRRQGQPQVLAWLYPLPAAARVRLRQGRGLLLDQQWAPSAG
ncbi:tetratricopeptide repeat protein [Myxococcota bacterium]|nr:tetratricopeptide repeat protein [Myxococcota bacterium]